MTRIASCLIYTGFTQVSHRAGLSGLHASLADGLMHDRRSFPFLALRPWDADTKTDAELVGKADAKLTIAVCFSYGAGEALVNFAKHHAKPIDLAILIDPVTRYRWLKWRSLMHGGDYKVPENVKRVAVMRTLNKPTLTSPVGHDVVTGKGTQVVQHVVYGTRDRIADFRHNGWSPLIEGIVSDLHHTNIDDSDEVHRRAVVLIERLLNGEL